MSEKSLGLPRISLHLAMGPHVTAQDYASTLNNYISWADVIIPEVCGWAKSTLDVSRTVSQKGNLGGILFGEGLTHFLRLINGSKKAITFIDVPDRHPNHLGHNALDRRFMHEENALLSLPSDQRSPDFPRLLVEANYNYGKDAVGLVHEREQIMIGNFIPAIQAVLEEFPDLRQADPLKVLVQIGYAHLGLYKGFKSQGIPTTRSLPEDRVFDFNTELLRRLIHGKDTTLELKYRAALQTYIGEETWWRTLDDVTGLSLKSVAIFRRIVALFNIEEIESAFFILTPSNRFSISEELLASKKLTLPHSEKGISDLLGEIKVLERHLASQSATIESRTQNTV